MEREKSERAASVRRMTELLDTTVDFVEQDLPYDLRRCVPNALLNIALARLLAQEGRDGALRVLTALAAAVASGADPATEGPIRLTHGDRPVGRATPPEPRGPANIIPRR